MSMTPADNHYTHVVLDKHMDENGNINWEQAYESLASSFDEYVNKNPIKQVSESDEELAVAYSQEHSDPSLFVTEENVKLEHAFKAGMLKEREEWQIVVAETNVEIGKLQNDHVRLNKTVEDLECRLHDALGDNNSELKREIEILRSKESQFKSTIEATMAERDEMTQKYYLECSKKAFWKCCSLSGEVGTESEEPI